ncbi:DciA family protein [Streptomyces sp. NPDC059718]
MTTPEPSGIDLARVALRAAQEDAKRRSTSASTKRSRRRTGAAPARGAGRDPVGLGAAISSLVAARGWETPVVGGSLVDHWATLAPELAAHVAVLTWDESTATLELLADSPAYATQARLLQQTLLQRIADTAGPEAVRTIKVHQPGSTTRTPARPAAAVTTESPIAAPVEPERPGRSRADAPAGYHLALAAAQEAARAAERSGFEQETQERAAQHDAALRLSREPEESFVDGQAAIEAACPRTASSDDARLRALAFKRGEREGRFPAARPARMDRTA